MRSLLRSALHGLLLASFIAIGFAAGIGALHSFVWAAAFALVGALVGGIVLNTKWVRNTAVTLVTIFACLLVGEGAISVTRGSTAPPPNGAAAAPVANTVARFEPESLFVPDAALGWRLRPASTIRARRARGEHTIYDVTYTIGPEGHRVTPASRPDGDTVLFLGDSFMFGDGLPDTETVPQLFATKTGARLRVINLGVSAYGPHQVLRQIEQGIVDRAVAGQKVKAVVLYFNDDQLPRAAGDKNMEWWWQVAPQYEVTSEGLRLTGTAAEAWARRGPIERAVSESLKTSVIASVSRRIVRIVPQMRLSEAVLRQIRVSLQERYGVELLVIYWSKDPSKFYPTNITWMIERSGAPMMFIPDLMPAAGLTLENALIPEDGHPNMRLNDAIATALAKRIAP